ncbi:MAG: CheR family methyltransferase [Elusimicrobiota bacterium]
MSPADRAFPVVGIGASAGGHEAVSRLISHLPRDTGIAFVIVQGRESAGEGIQPGLLQMETLMPVAPAEDGAKLEPDRVYVVPPDVRMVVRDGRLRLAARPDAARSQAVDCFLASLAVERRNRAVAVLLSGGSADGARGVEAIKSEGGLVFALDGRPAGSDDVPGRAAAGFDFILPPEKIAAELAAAASHPALTSDLPEIFRDTESLGRMFALLRRATGVDYGHYKPGTIQRRLLRRLMLHKLESWREYMKLLETKPDEVRALHEDLLIHVTSFFRDPKSIAHLRAKALPRIMKSLPPDAPIRVWVPGCSTGEEAYTLAISLFDFLGEREEMNPVKIFATDVSDVSLERARAGVYGADIGDCVPPPLLRRFFAKTPRGYEIAKRVREACVFARHELTKDPPFGALDLISCCNLLIYLGPTIQRRILPMFHRALRTDGALILGGAETGGGLDGLFAPAGRKSRVYFKKPASAKVHAPLGLPTPAAAAPKGNEFFRSAGWSGGDVMKTADRILLARYAPAGVIVAEDMSVQFFRGQVGRFLEPKEGRADLALSHMLPASAAVRLKALLARAKKSGAPAAARGIALDADAGGRAGKAAIEAIPFRLPLSGDLYFIVLFEDDDSKTARGRAKPASRLAAPAAADVPASRLKAELESLRCCLRNAFEEHAAVNAELQSSNEELQSANEELEIAKEELQTANERLSAVNAELETRNVELVRLTDDLLNLIAGARLAIVMVSSDLRIRRFSPAAQTLLNLVPGDAGRPLSDVKAEISLSGLEELVRKVIETAATREVSVRDRANRSYALRVEPYRTATSEIAGAVLVFIDEGKSRP